MKKFLSLVLSLVMAMSLVTVSAGAADDKGFTDASDIEYKEAVDVMSGVGIISGYRDDSFRPDGALTRGAAAKIIAYLNLGTKTADVLSCTSAPYKDVKPSDTFAPYIAYVKNAKICDGYSDGTFRAGAPLTGFAFNKMLLTSLGYDSKAEEFTGANWSVAVAKLAVKIGLTDGNDDFTGLDTCTREEACLYALNTLQATEVEYDNKGTSININGAEIVTGASAAEKVTTNNKDGKNIDKETNGDNEYYLEFAEDHFDDLELKSADDDFGADANKWVYKDKEIGTYAKDADYEFTTTADGDTNEEKLEDMDLDEYKMADGVSCWFDGDEDKDYFDNNGRDDKELKDLDDNDEAGGQLVKLLKKGRLVKVYAEDQTINNVVVIDTYLAKIDSISSASDKVTLEVKDKAETFTVKVDDDNDFYAELADMDEDDYVLVTLADKDVKSVAIPETEKGTISRISKNSDKVCDGLTFDGTKYDLSYTANNKKDGDAFSTNMELKADYDSTLYLDTYGYAIWIDDVEAESDYMVAIDTYSSVEDGKIVTFVQGYDMEGNEVSLNIGTDKDEAVKGNDALTPGTVYKYSTDGAKNHGDYLLTAEKDNETTSRIQVVEKIEDNEANKDKYNLKASSVSIEDNDPIKTHYFDDDVKFIFLGKDSAKDTPDYDMDDVTVETECQKVKGQIIYVLDDAEEFKDKEIIAVIIKDESDNATGDDVAYVKSVDASADIDGDDATEYTLYIEGDEVEDVVSKDEVHADSFVTYAKNDDGTYELDTYEPTDHDDDDTAVIRQATVTAVPTEKVMTLTEDNSIDGDVFADIVLKDLNCKNAEVIDLTDREDIGNMSDLKDAVDGDAELNSVKVSVVFNGDKTDDDYKMVSYIFVNNVDYKDSDKDDKKPEAGTMKSVKLTADGKVTVKLTDDATDAQAYTVELQQLNKNTGKYMTVNSDAGTVTIAKNADEGSVNLAKGLMNVGDVYKVVCSNGDNEMESNVVTVLPAPETYSVTDGSVTFFEDADCSTSANGDYEKDATLYAKGEALKALTVADAAAVKDLELTTAPTTASDSAIYSFKICDDVTSADFTVADGWYTVTLTDTELSTYYTATATPSVIVEKGKNIIVKVTTADDEVTESQDVVTVIASNSASVTDAHTFDQADYSTAEDQSFEYTVTNVTGNTEITFTLA